jgi:hypothetical protein
MIPLIKIPTNVFPLSGAIATKVLSYEADCNDPRFYQILGENFRFCFARDDWKFTGI